MNDHSSLPARGQRRLTPFDYDPVPRWIFHRETFKHRRVQLATPQSGQRVLDLGCGTAKLTAKFKQAQGLAMTQPIPPRLLTAS